MDSQQLPVLSLHIQREGTLCLCKYCFLIVFFEHLKILLVLIKYDAVQSSNIFSLPNITNQLLLSSWKHRRGHSAAERAK